MCHRVSLLAVVLGSILLSSFPASAWDEADGKAWIDRFVFSAPPVGELPMEGGKARLPVLRLDQFPGATRMVRASLPFAPGTLPAGKGLTANLGDRKIPVDLRVLTVHPDAQHSVRRAMATFPHDRDFSSVWNPLVTFEISDTPCVPAPILKEGSYADSLGNYGIRIDESSVSLTEDGNAWWTATVVAPERSCAVPIASEIVEKGPYYLWVRVFVPDPKWPRIIEARLDYLGRAKITAHLQRLEGGDGFAPDLGWRISEPCTKPSAGESTTVQYADNKARFIIRHEGLLVTFPDSPHFLKGELAEDPKTCLSVYRLFRNDDKVPMQSAAWRSATAVLGRNDGQGQGGETQVSFCEDMQGVTLLPDGWLPVYQCSDPPPMDRAFEEVRLAHRSAMGTASLAGDDFGNVTTMPKSGPFGMNRLNHCPAIFDEYYRSGNRVLRDTALNWCSNFYDLTVWWGENRKDEFGGTRYNNSIANGDKAHVDDQKFMWRSNTAVHFCTKGYDSFLYAYEETGDPRYALALRWQTDYASRMIHTNQGECRNIGDVLDFVRLYEFTGHRPYLDEALRLFRELRDKLGPDGLFSQGGQPIEADGPFIDEDTFGYKHPFAKPYIIGYALQGLPRLARHVPDEPRLVEVIRAVAKFLVESQDPVGGWRYPHPKSSRVLVDQAMEHAMQLSRAAGFLESQGDDINPILDAIERVLRARILGFQKTGAFLSGIQGWEEASGALKDGKNIHDLYKKPSDRDGSRDYAEGAVSAGGSCPEAVVYFSEVLDFYAAHRDCKRLLEAGPELQKILDRAPKAAEPIPVPADDHRISAPTPDYPKYGMEDGLPTFAEVWRNRVADMDMGSIMREGGISFDEWKRQGRKKVAECLLTAPHQPQQFDPVVIGQEDRGNYVARKLVFGVSQDCRIPAYLLMPKGAGPFPAVIALHDHGAHFSIGKEKVVRPFGVDASVAKDAREWVDKYYGGRFIGDALADSGYAVLAIDALFWGERGRKEGPEYEAQQQLAANLFQLGMSWLGVITWDDVRSADFLATVPEVDPERIGAMGLSMGSHRTWMLCAMSDRVSVGMAICWMGTSDVLLRPGNNQTRGQSAFSMIAPGLRNYLDYPGVAALAAPKPMLFYNGEKDALFPVEGVEKAYKFMHAAWDAAKAGDKLETRLWPFPHEFNREMQDAAFAWLDGQLRT